MRALVEINFISNMLAYRFSYLNGIYVEFLLFVALHKAIMTILRLKSLYQNFILFVEVQDSFLRFFVSFSI